VLRVRAAACAAAVALLAAAGPSHATVEPPVVPLDRYATELVNPNALTPKGVTTNSYPLIRQTDFIGIPFAGVTSGSGGVIAVEHVLRDDDVAGGSYYLPCKAAPTALPNVESPFGGEPYKAACENPTDPSYFKSGPFGSGLHKVAPVFGGAITIPNVTQSDACYLGCQHEWADRTSAIAVEIYLKTTVDGRLVTDFDHVRARFNASGFNHSLNGGLFSRNYGVVRPLGAYERGTSRLQGYVFTSGHNYLSAGSKRLVFSVFENDANGKSSTGMPLQAFSAFSSNGGFFTTGVLYSGYYKVKIRDTETNKCVMRRMMPITTMGERVDLHLDAKAFGMRGAVEVPC
jgi:hypothetical protein